MSLGLADGSIIQIYREAHCPAMTMNYEAQQLNVSFFLTARAARALAELW